MEDVIEVRLVTERLLGDTQGQTGLLGIYIALLASDDGLGAVSPDDNGNGIVEICLLDFKRIDRFAGIGFLGYGACAIDRIERLFCDAASNIVSHSLSSRGGRGLLNLILIYDQALESAHVPVVRDTFVINIHDLHGDGHTAGVDGSGTLMISKGIQIIGDTHSCFSFQSYR